MFVCLWSPAWRTAADSLADLSPALLTVAPRVVTEERRGGLVWVDARGLDAERVAREALEVLRKLGLTNVRVGLGKTAIVAELSAVATGRGTGDEGRGETAGLPTAVEASRGFLPSSDQLQLTATSAVPVPGSPFPVSSLGSLPVSILEPDPALATLLDGIGVETCADLAALEGESVEVRLGTDGVRLWKLARGEDDRLIFSPIPRELPHASLEWSDYALTDTERLLFSVNALLGTVCEKLAERGSLAREMALDLRLADGNTLANAIRAGRPTASRKTWLRLARLTLERLVLPAGVVGVALRAVAIVTDDGQQGDLFDRGFATAAATEAALASLAEDQGDVVVVPENTAHPLLERRTSWVGHHGESGVNGNGGNRERGRGNRKGAASSRQRSAPVPAVPGSLFPVSTMPDSRLTLYLLPTPRAVETRTEARRDHVVPTGYRDGGAWYAVLSAAGPDRVSGERWGDGFAREYYRCVIDDGGMVWLYRDARADGWYLHGWWD
jgi:hypothetical protein